jgi:hypothetical protein
MSNELNIYYATTQAEVVIGDAPTEYGTYYITEIDTVGEIICATSRGRARAMLSEEFNIEFTTPMSIRKVQHFLTQDEMVSDWFLSGDGFFVDDKNVLHHENQLDDLIAEYELNNE